MDHGNKEPLAELSPRWAGQARGRGNVARTLDGLECTPQLLRSCSSLVVPIPSAHLSVPAPAKSSLFTTQLAHRLLFSSNPPLLRICCAHSRWPAQQVVLPLGQQFKKKKKMIKGKQCVFALSTHRQGPITISPQLVSMCVKRCQRDKILEVTAETGYSLAGSAYCPHKDIGPIQLKPIGHTPNQSLWTQCKWTLGRSIASQVASNISCQSKACKICLNPSSFI